MEEINLLSDLIVEEKISFDKIRVSNGLNKNEIKDYVSALNEKYSPLMFFSNSSLYLAPNAIENIFEKKLYEKIYIQAPRKITEKILILRLLIDKNYLPLDEVAELLQVSKNTGIKILKELKNYFSSQGVFLKYNRQNGYFIEGNGEKVWEMIPRVISELLTSSIGKYFIFYNKLLNISEYQKVSRIVYKVESKLSNLYTDNSKERLCYIIAALLKRYKFDKSFPIRMQVFNDLQGTYEFEIICQLLKSEYNTLTVYDASYLALFILSESVNFYNPKLEENNIDTYIIEFIEKLETDKLLNFNDKTKLFNNLYIHLKPLLYRNRLGLHIINPISSDFIEKYKFLFLKVKKAAVTFKNILYNELSDDELALISMIIQANLNQSTSYKNKGLEAIVVCQNGQAISHLIESELKELFPNINFLGVASSRDFDDKKVTADIIFSTVPLIEMDSVYIVKTMMTEEEKKDLIFQVDSDIKLCPKKQAKSIIRSIVNVLPVEYKNDIERELEKYFERNIINTGTEEYQILRSPQQIEIIENINWSDIVEKSFLPMLNRGTIERIYIEKVDEDIKKNYEVQIISEKVLLPHSDPNNGVITPDCQILIIPSGVAAPDGKKINIIIGLAPGFNNEHVKWLVFLNKFLSNEINLKNILVSNSYEIFNYMKEGYIHAFK